MVMDAPTREGFGLACQVGLALNQPTIGVAKTRFYGRIEKNRIMSPDGELLGKVVTAGNGKATM